MTIRFNMILRSLFVVLALAMSSHAFAIIKISADDQNICYVGRIDQHDKRAPIFYWPGTSVLANFTGSSITVCLKDSGHNYYNVIIDGNATAPIIIKCQQQQTDYPVVNGLKKGTHRIEIFRRSEISEGPTTFLGFYLDDGKKLAKAPQLPRRKIEFFGDSITAGYGNESTDGTCTPANTNNYLSYAAMTARALHAQYVCIAQSGIGVTTSRNKDESTFIMTQLYDRLNPEQAHSWNFPTWTPDVVVVNLGENDNWIYKNKVHENPGAEVIEQRYSAFIQSLRDKYPHSLIICAIGPMDAVFSAWPAYLAEVVKQFNARGDKHVYFLPLDIRANNPKSQLHGGWTHPNVLEHQTTANILTSFIEKLTK